MRIAILTDGVHPYVIGGMQKHSYFLVRELARNKHLVYLFHCNPSKYDASKLEFFTEEERKYIKSFLLSFPGSKHFPFHYINESYEYSEAIYKQLLPILPELDFVLAQGFCGWALLKHKNKSERPPVAVHFHGLGMFQNIPSLKTKLTQFALQMAVKRNIQLADYTISFGKKISAILRNIVSEQKIWEVYGGIEPSWLTDNVNPLTDKIRFVFVGRYERRKGIPELNEAINQLLPTSTFSVDFIGEIPEDKKVTNAAIRYHGKLSSEEEIKKILSGCDVLLCPSYAEGMPTVIMEAMAQGLAIIATDVGAVSALVDNDNGWLIESPKVNNIAAAMKSAMEDKVLQQKKSASLEKVKKDFLLEPVTRKLIEKIEACKKNT